MSKFTANVNFETEFDGDQVKFVLRRLKNYHMITLGPLFTDANRLGFIGALKMIDGAKDVIKESIISMAGLTDSAGNPLKVEDALDEMYFSSLWDRVLGHLISVSRLQEVDAKKSEAPLLVVSVGENPATH